jgi:predicted cobalt transporter CbtA
MRAWRLIVGLLASTLLVADAQAAKCVPMTLARQFERADAVVSGLIESVEPVDAQGHVIKADVTVERGWKGALSGRVSVVTEGSGAVGFETGQRYLIYLESVPAQGYATDRCSGLCSAPCSMPASRSA